MANKKNKRSDEVKQKTEAKSESHLLRNAQKDMYFWAVDGNVLKNLFDLGDELEQMLPEAYKYHVAQDKNDFANWVRDVIGDENLAAALASAAEQKESQIIVLKRLVQLLKT